MVWIVAGILLFTGLVAKLEGTILKKKKQYKELAVFLVLLGIGCVLTICLALQVTFPNPLDALTFIYQPFSRFVFELLT